jgi:hypothetical protein
MHKANSNIKNMSLINSITRIKLTPYLICYSVFLLSSCAPVNLNFETARLVKRGEVEVQGSQSNYIVNDKYYNYVSSSSDQFRLLNANFGGKIGYGISDNYNIKIRFEQIRINQYSKYQYLELEQKINLINNRIALGLPIATYFSKGEIRILKFDPRLYLTLINIKDKFEFTLIPKAHMFFMNGKKISPAISAGFSFSPNLNKWAIRPEIGYDKFWSFGIGLNCNINQMYSR